jgi:diadenosine tetraphosphate (Ap4A) HIT family hydrolase
MTCVFCEIVADDEPRSVVFEDDLTLAFMDIMPMTLGHLLVVPREHATYLADLAEGTAEAMVRTATRCAAALRGSSLRAEGINLFLADGAAAGQEVFHTHLHVLPRFRGDGFGLSIRYDPPPARRTLDVQAAEISAQL